MKSISDSHLYEESHLKMLRLLESNPGMSQRELADELGVSLGKINYCIKALVDKGMVKMQNFRNSQNKLAYAYLLTPAGLTTKTELAARYLKIKIAEYEVLKQEIVQLQNEAD
ncbi:MAG: MarR family EPS-associated transcriptional regulator [Burkholderiaceae bacterium]